jgi:SpoVK/Ycf46/Vps4 family AAA+-type ATPase
MASADQVKALLDSFVDGDEQRFFSIAMQVAAHEAKLGHGKLAEEIRAAIDQAKRRRGPGQLVPISRPRGDLANLLTVSYPKVRLAHMVLAKSLDKQIQRVIREQRHAGQILDQGLTPRRKLLLVGPPGTGKTLTASVLASELGLPLLQVRLDGLITRFMGETAAKLRQVFDSTTHTRGVYFFDEFDAIGAHRGAANDVGEIRRVLNSFLQMIEQDLSHSLVLAATNHPELLDRALFRRFDDVLHYELPGPAQIANLLKARLSKSAAPGVKWTVLAKTAAGLSYAEVGRAADEVLKDGIIHERSSATSAAIRSMLNERQATGHNLKKAGHRRGPAANGRRG